MLNDNLLSDRLNSYREGNIEEQPKQFEELEDNPLNILEKYEILFKIIDIGVVFFHSIAYGFAAKTIFSTDWTILSVLAVGFSADLIISNIFNIFKK